MNNIFAKSSLYGAQLNFNPDENCVEIVLTLKVKQDNKPTATNPGDPLIT